MSKCAICGEELLTGDIHWEIGLCNTCYNKTYKSEEQKYVDMLHKESSELLVNSLAEKDKKITELQKQLEEKEKLLQYGMTEIKKLHKRINDIVKRDEKLFKSQPAEIIDEIKKQMDARKLEYKTMENDFHIRGLKIDRIFEILDEILQEYLSK